MLNTTSTRRNELQNSYYFWCNCEKCTEPESFATAAICPSCDSACDAKEDFCSKCEKEFLPSFKQKFIEANEFTAKNLESMKNIACILFLFCLGGIYFWFINFLTKCFKDLDLSKKCLDKQKDVMHPLNIQHVRTVESAFDACVDLGYWGEAEKFGLELIPGYL